ncbi:hypothetical protein ONZ45_g14540 [Pleurotus djamor]|nr:hypothetical protein ONZ45_g14540 [Pleurotus djamor]
MPDIALPGHPFDLVFHDSRPALFTGLVSGEVHAYAYDDSGNSSKLWSTQLFKKACRCLDIDKSGEKIWAGGKGKAIAAIDTSSGKIIDKRLGAHEASVNRIKVLSNNLFCTGDDDGVVKLWDPRTKDATRKYTHHFDYITDFLWLEDKKQLVATSGDGTLSVIDTRSKKTTPLAHSEDQEDELLSIVSIKGGTKFVVGSQLGILSIFNRSAGWGDCVDRVPGHPQSVDTLLSVPPQFANSKETTILSGSSDGYVRALEILPTKLLGVVVDHGDFPVERLAFGKGGGPLLHDDDSIAHGSTSFVTKPPNESPDSDVDEDSGVTHGERLWLGSVGHDEFIKLTDIGRFFANLSAPSCEDDPTGTLSNSDDDEKEPAEVPPGEPALSEREAEDLMAESDDSSDARSPLPTQKRKRKQKQKDPLVVKKKVGRNQLDVGDGTFFSEL